MTEAPAIETRPSGASPRSLPRIRRSALPPPQYTVDGIAGWQQGAVLGFAVPPGAPATWTCLLSYFGFALFDATDYRGGISLFSLELLQALLARIGHPTARSPNTPLAVTLPVPAARVTDALRGCLTNDAFAVRQRAAILLGHLGDAASLQHLGQQLGDRDNDARRGACEGLGLLGDRRAAQTLACLPWDDDPSVNEARFIALDGLDAWGDVASTIDRTSDAPAARFAAAVYAALEEGEPAQLAEFVAPGASFRFAALQVFHARPELGASVVERFVRVLCNGGEADALVAVAGRTLASVGEPALEAIGELLTHNTAQVRRAACAALATNPVLAGQLLPALRTRLEDEDDYDAKQEVALAMLVAAPGDPEATRWLHTKLLLNQPGHRHGFIHRLGSLPLPPELRPYAMLAGACAPDLALIPFMASPLDEELGSRIPILLALGAPDLMGPTLERIARDDFFVYPMKVRVYAAAGCLLAGHSPGPGGIVFRLLLSCGEGPIAACTEDLSSHVGALIVLALRDVLLRGAALQLMTQLDRRTLALAEPALRQLQRSGEGAPHARVLDGLLARPWPQDSVAEKLARLLARSLLHDGPVTTNLAVLHEQRPDLAVLYARGMVGAADLQDARNAALILAAPERAEDIPERIALGRLLLTTHSWISRDAGARLLGAIPRSLWPSDSLEAAVQDLTRRALEDSDGDVQHAARSALFLLGRALVVPESTPEAG